MPRPRLQLRQLRPRGRWHVATPRDTPGGAAYLTPGPPPSCPAKRFRCGGRTCTAVAARGTSLPPRARALAFQRTTSPSYDRTVVQCADTAPPGPGGRRACRNPGGAAARLPFVHRAPPRAPPRESAARSLPVGRCPRELAGRCAAVERLDGPPTPVNTATDGREEAVVAPILAASSRAARLDSGDPTTRTPRTKKRRRGAAPEPPGHQPGCRIATDDERSGSACRTAGVFAAPRHVATPAEQAGQNSPTSHPGRGARRP